MVIPPHELQAFLALAQILNFTKAANHIHITQSALSQRIQNLEKRLEVTLFVRTRRSIKLTEASSKLLRYCHAKKHLETELINDLTWGTTQIIGGHLRIAAFSSVLQSVVIPALAPLLRNQPAIRFEFSRYHINELPNVLMSAQADFVIMDFHYQKSNIQTCLLGYEKYVLIQSTQYPKRNIYLDYNNEDNITDKFFKTQNMENHSYSKSYVDDIQGILQGVSLGLGEGIVPLHLLNKQLPINKVKNMKPLEMPVVLHYFQQPYYTKLQEITMKTLQENSFKYLK